MSWSSLQRSLGENLEAIETLYISETSHWLANVAAFRAAPVEECWRIRVRKADSWTNQNTVLSTYLHDYRSQASVLGNAAVKLGLYVIAVGVAGLDFQSGDFDSLVVEILGQIQTFSNIFSRFLECQLSFELQDSVAQAHRGLLVHFRDLLSAISARAPKTSIEGAAGMVLKLCEDIQKLPITHKISIRRFIMQKCMIIKETVEEFQGYLLEAAENRAGRSEKVEEVKEDEEGEDDFNEEEDEKEYSEEEIVLVEQCVSLLAKAQETIKTLLQVLTLLGETRASNNPDSGLMYEHIAVCGVCVQAVEGDCIDLGAELYPPLDFPIASLQGQDVTSVLVSSSDDNEVYCGSKLLLAYRSLHCSIRKALYLIKRETSWNVAPENVKEKVESIEESLSLSYPK